MPKRIQRKRTKGWRMPPGTLCANRPGFWGNPFVGPDAVEVYRRWLTIGSTIPASIMVRVAKGIGNDVSLHETANPDRTGSNVLGAIEELRMYDYVACYCGLDKPC